MRSLPSTNSSANHTFSKAPQVLVNRSKFDRSHGVKTTFNEGLLVPILVDEVLPGDTFNLRMNAFARLATPIFPIMDNMYLESFFFVVPLRLLWDNFQKFNGEQFSPGDSTDFLVPQIETPAGGVVGATLFDYMGIPTSVAGLKFNSLHARAYNLIWNEWFRDENLQNSVVVNTSDGPDTYADYSLLRRGKRYDYFTSCLPFPQKGPNVTLPLGQSADVVLKDPVTGGFLVKDQAGTDFANITNFSSGAGSNLVGTANPVVPGVGPGVVFDPNGQYQVDLSTATAATINDLRLAFQTQKLYERDARGGTRYTEIVRSHFGVISPDARLQRPEYVGGGSSPVIINPVAQTFETNASDPLGKLGAYGVCAPENHGFTYSSTEHCVLLGLVSVRSDINYQQGLERMWSRQTRLDYYWPALAHIGEQAVLNKEIYAQGTSVDEQVFGYQERYAEYRYKPSQITGLFRSAATGSLDSWHLAQTFGNLPALNPTFIEENAPMARIKAVDFEPDFLFDCFFDYKCVRPMPVYSVPGFVDHF